VDQAKLFTDRAFIFQSKENDIQADRSIIDSVFSTLPQALNVDKVELVDSFIDFDVYKVFSKDKIYLIKLSFVDKSEILEREAEALQLVSNKVTPSLIHSGRIIIGEPISYLIQSYENGYGVDDFGRYFVGENIESLNYSLKKLVDNPAPSKSIRDNIDNVLSSLNVREFFYDDAIEAIKVNLDLNKIDEFIQDLSSELTNIYDTSVLDRDYFCHGSLLLQNIIFRDGYFKFVNLDRSFKGHYFLDYSQLLLDFGLDKNVKLKFAKMYCKSSGFEYDADEYKLCEKVNILIVLASILRDYLVEIYMFDSSRPLKICKIVALFGQYFDQFSRFKFFDKYKTFLTKTITNPVTGVEKV